ncbi:MAG: hypothetical protein M1556_05270 [Candidatus Thermoplasmatota archaeon]|nr:hypothetical protein [Candidatus Thermoplasmatota archaeon]MCL6003034.1 hypothetical protein [Candidatus Thermoplasmatota archaeon]
MSSISIKTKNRVIVKFINGRKLEDISLEERISLSSVEEVIEEWRQGYINMDLGNDIAQELKELAFLIRDKEITPHDIVEGYHYYGIFKEKDREKIIGIVNEIYSIGEERRSHFVKTAEKMMKLAKYANIEYVDIPKAIDDMVERGKELNREIKSKEILNLELTERLTKIRKELESFEEEKKSLEKEIAFSNYLKQELTMDGKWDENAIKNTIEGLKHSNYDIRKIEETSAQIALIGKRELTVDQFLKISRYFEELMNLGLTVPTMEKILDNVKEDGVTIDEYLNERAVYVRDKLAYLKSLKELMEAHKRAEKQMKQINEEISLKKLKLERT